METSLHVAPASHTQLSELSELLGILFAQEREFSVDARRQHAGLDAILAHPDLGMIHVAQLGGHIVGMVVELYSFSTALGAPVAILEDLVVRPQARGHGVGRALIQAALDSARARGCLRVSLLTDGDNHRAHALYARFGFQASSMQLMRLHFPDTPTD